RPRRRASETKCPDASVTPRAGPHHLSSVTVHLSSIPPRSRCQHDRSIGCAGATPAPCIRRRRGRRLRPWPSAGTSKNQKTVIPNGAEVTHTEHADGGP